MDIKIETQGCPLYFEDHEYGGVMYDIENFTDIKFGQIRTTIINNRPYFCAIDICNGLLMPIDHIGKIINDIANDIFCTLYEETLGNNMFNPDFLTPRFQIGGLEIGNDWPIRPEELYYILDSEITHNSRYGEVKQIVKTAFISEPMLYMLLFKSRKREAIKFKVWLATYILPNMRLLGREKSVNLLSDEVNSIADKLGNIDQKCNTIINNQGYINCKVDNLGNRVDAVGYNTNNILFGEQDISNKVTDIASGLSFIFGKK